MVSPRIKMKDCFRSAPGSGDWIRYLSPGTGIPGTACGRMPGHPGSQTDNLEHRSNQIRECHTTNGDVFSIRHVAVFVFLVICGTSWIPGGRYSGDVLSGTTPTRPGPCRCYPRIARTIPAGSVVFFPISASVIPSRFSRRTSASMGSPISMTNPSGS